MDCNCPIHSGTQRHGLDCMDAQLTTALARIEELEGALRIRIEDRNCRECGVYIQEGFDHAQTCRYYAIDAESLKGGE